VIEIEARIRNAATDKTLREAARVIWAREAVKLFEDQPRTGLRISDSGNCVRQVYGKLNGNPEAFDSHVQLFNLDEGTLTGCWWACLLAASLEADGYVVELEPEVTLDGIPGHIDLYYTWPSYLQDVTGKAFFEDTGVVEFKKTGSWTASPQRWHVLQLGSYLAAKGVEDGAIVSIAPAAKVNQIAVTWYKLSDLQFDVAVEWERLSAALGPVEPTEDAVEAFRCKGCPVVRCQRNPAFVTDGLLEKLEESYAARNG
jgi:hypothetical protein